MAILSFLVFLLLLGILVFIHELGHFAVAKWTGMRVDEFAVGFPPRIWKKKKKGTLYTVGAVPFGGYVRIHGENPEEQDDDPRSFEKKSVWARMAVILAGVAMNLLFAFVVLTVAFSVGFSSLTQDLTEVKGAVVTSSKILVLEVPGGTSAENSGLRPGDVILKVSNPRTGEETTMENVSQLQAYTKARQEEGVAQVVITYDRAGELQEAAISIQLEGYPLGGISLRPLDVVRVPFYKAPLTALKEMKTMVEITGDALGQFGKRLFFRGQLDPNVSGPVGIYQATATATKMGVAQIVLLAVLLSVNLALLNLVPVPALDGGRFVFLVTEAAFGKRVIRRKIEAILTQVSFLLLILLLIVLTVRDVFKLF